MSFELYAPCDQLRPFIKSFRIISTEHELTNRVIPNTSFALSFQIRGKISSCEELKKSPLPNVLFSGLRKSVRLFQYAPHTMAIIVLFSETGISAFFKKPLYELFEESITLDNLFPQSEISFLVEQLSEIDSNVTRVALIKKFLLSKLNNNCMDSLISSAIAKIYYVNGNVRIKDLTSQLHISHDAFEKRFRKITGASPKQFSQIVKLNAVIRQHTKNQSFLDMAFQHGYYDQPHFNKDFKIFTGQTPSGFFKSASYW